MTNLEAYLKSRPGDLIKIDDKYYFFDDMDSQNEKLWLKYANEDYFLSLDFDDTFKGQFIKEM